MSLDKPNWYRTPVEREVFRTLTTRRDGPGLYWFGLWLFCLIGTGLIAWNSLGGWGAVPAFFLYGTLYCFAESIAHECSHSTAFKSKRLNENIYLFVCFLLFKERTYHRWMHGRHHTHTIINGEDPEIQHPRPISLLRFFVLEPLRISSAYHFFKALTSHAFNNPTKNAQKWIPVGKHAQMFFWSRVQLITYLGIFATIVTTQSWAALLFFPGARFYGALVQTLFSSTQHAGLADDVEDHRQNSRTILLGPVGRFLYWNMNYHLEHHMYPMVPFHALPKLHDAIKHDCPPPYSGMIEVYRELLPVIWQQRFDKNHVVRRKLVAPEDGTPKAA